MGYLTKIVTSSKWGTQEVLIDAEDEALFDSRAWHLYSSERHHSCYLQCNKTTKHDYSKLHRLIMGVTDSKLVVDHINGNGLNNRK